ncbi:MAG: ABC transporter ATP-binding protein [Thermoanaerobaculia bacterium]
MIRPVATTTDALDSGPKAAESVADIAALPAAVVADGICRRYGRRWALIDVAFRVPRGSALMVAGRNGSGKSTLFRVLSTAIRPDRGTAMIEGYDIHRHKHDVRLRTALLGHYAYTYEALSPVDNLKIFARLTGKEATRAAILPLLAQVELAGRADDPVATFSAGMRKRLSIARVLMQDCSVVFLDEPYAALDPPGFRFVDGLFHKLRERGVTVLIATHELERTAQLCDYGMVLEQGRVNWFGTAHDLPRFGGLDPATLPEGGTQ